MTLTPFQPVAQGQQFIDLGDDAVLLGEGEPGVCCRASFPFSFSSYCPVSLLSVPVLFG